MVTERIQEMINGYSFVTIIALVSIGLTSLMLWYWSGRRPLKKH